MWDPVEGGWVSGLVDGEGHLYLAVSRRGPSGRHKRIEFGLSVRVRSDDEPMLQEFGRILGVGRFRRHAPPNLKHKRPNPQAGWYANRHDEVEVLVRFFRQFPLRSKKAREFALWSKAFEEFRESVVATERVAVRTGERNRPGRRHVPLAGTPLKQLREIPDALFDRMRWFAERIKAERCFKALAQ